MLKTWYMMLITTIVFARKNKGHLTKVQIRHKLIK